MSDTPDTPEAAHPAHGPTPTKLPPLRRRYPATYWGVVGLLIALALTILAVLPTLRDEGDPTNTATVRIDGVGRATVRDDPAAGVIYDVEVPGGDVIIMSPQAFASYAFEHGHGRGLLYRTLNITDLWGVAWVGLGLLGQVLFTGRMVVQWLVSESHRRSVVPVSFWWMSLVGASMLLTYFAWRRDIIGVLGQSTGWFIYARNLYLIYLQRHDPAPAA